MGGSELQKLSQIRAVYREWADVYERDDARFDEAYPELRSKYTKLMKAVRENRKARGDIKPRPGSKKS